MNHIDAMVEQLEWHKPVTESEAMSVAEDALSNYIDNELIYTSRILELLDGSTNDNIAMSDYEDILDAISASTYYQLEEQWADGVYDAIDKYIEDNLTGEALAEFINTADRDVALEALNG